MQILKPEQQETFVIKTKLVNILKPINIIKYKKVTTNKKKVKKKDNNFEQNHEEKRVGYLVTPVIHFINDIVNNANQLVIQTYFFLKSWILMKYQNKIPLPKITDETIKLIFKVLSVTKVEKKLRDDDNIKIYADIEKFYNEHYCKLFNQPKFDCSNYRQIFNYLSKDIVKNINNNITFHFHKYIEHYINGMFYVDYDDNLTKKENLQLQKIFKKEAHLVKQDLINNTRKSNPKYHSWIDNTKLKILPEIDNLRQEFGSNLITNPQIYLSNIIYINSVLENLGRKTFHILPLRTSCVPKYIPIDTEIIVKLLMKEEEGNSKYAKNISENKDQIWRKFFDLDNKIFKKTKGNFNHMIYTDGYAVSILFSTDKKKEENDKEFKNIKNYKLEFKELCKGKTKEQKKEMEKNRKIAKQERENKKKEKDIEETKKRREEYKKLSKEEKNKLKLEKLNKLDTEEKKINSHSEFPYLEDLTLEQIEKLKNSNLVFIDPGKIRLYTMIDNYGTILKYSNREYMKRTKRAKYNKKIKNFRDGRGITEIENLLANYNSKTCSYEKFSSYITLKNELNKKLIESYKSKIFRQLKWYAYIMKQRETDRLTSLIRKTYGKDCKLIMGDWCQSFQMKNIISTPMIGLKRKLRKKFEIINLDEYKTSKICHHTGKETKNLKMVVSQPKRDENKKIMRDKRIKDKKKSIISELVSKKIHSILTYEMENGRMGCINRDINSVKNMRKIVNNWLVTGERLENYSREKSREKQKKVRKKPSASTTS